MVKIKCLLIAILLLTIPLASAGFAYDRFPTPTIINQTTTGGGGADLTNVAFYNQSNPWDADQNFSTYQVTGGKLLAQASGTDDLLEVISTDTHAGLRFQAASGFDPFFHWKEGASVRVNQYYDTGLNHFVIDSTEGGSDLFLTDWGNIDLEENYFDVKTPMYVEGYNLEVTDAAAPRIIADSDSGGGGSPGFVVQDNGVIKGGFFYDENNDEIHIWDNASAIVKFLMDSNVLIENNITADYYFGDGSQLTGITAPVDLTNVAFYNQSNPWAANQTFLNVTAAEFFGDVANLDRIIGTNAVNDGLRLSSPDTFIHLETNNNDVIDYSADDGHVFSGHVNSTLLNILLELNLQGNNVTEVNYINPGAGDLNVGGDIIAHNNIDFDNNDTDFIGSVSGNFPAGIIGKELIAMRNVDAADYVDVGKYVVIGSGVDDAERYIDMNTDDGDVIIYMDADQINGGTENANPRIEMSQDGGAVRATVGFYEERDFHDNAFQINASHWASSPVEYLSGSSGAHYFYTGSTERISIGTGGLYLSNIPSPGNTQACLDAAGNSYIGRCTSLTEKKEGIVNVTDATSKCRALRPVMYKWKMNMEMKYDNADRAETYGFLVEEVEAIDTRLVTYDENGTLIGLDNNAFIGLMYECWQEVDDRLLKLEGGIKL